MTTTIYTLWDLDKWLRDGNVTLTASCSNGIWMVTLRGIATRNFVGEGGNLLTATINAIVEYERGTAQ